MLLAAANGPPRVKQLVKITSDEPAIVTSVSVTWQKPGPQALSLWRDLDSSVHPYVPFWHFEFDVIPPIPVQVRPDQVGKPITYDLTKASAPIRVNPLRPVFVGVRLAADQGGFATTQAPATRSVIEQFEPEHQPRPRSVLSRPAGEFAVEVKLSPELPPTPWFTDVTDSSGLGQYASQSIVWFDVDGDGDDDLLLSGPKLFRNDDGKFVDITATTGLADFASDSGAAADLDGDGDADLVLIARRRKDSVAVFLNQGQGRFARSTTAPRSDSLAWCVSLADFNADGLVDVFIGNGWDWNESFPFETDALWLGGSGGKFRDVSQAVGLDPNPGDARFTRVSLAVDLARRGQPSLFTGTYYLHPDRLWQFSGDELVDLSGQIGLTSIPNPTGGPGNGHALGINAGDIDNDGDLDILLANLIHPDWRGFMASNESMLFRNRGDGNRFDRIPLRDIGILFEETMGDIALADFDGDGWLDLFHQSAYHTADLYAGSKSGFQDRTYGSGLNIRKGSASAVSDFDGDGRPDLAASDGDQGVRLYRNITRSDPQIALRLVGRAPNLSAIGASVQIPSPAGTLTRTVVAGRGSGNQDSLAVSFPRPRAANVTATVTWPSGYRESFTIDAKKPPKALREGTGTGRSKIK